MINISEYIESGIIEAYVLGMAAPEEIQEVEELAIAHAEIRSAIDASCLAIEQFSIVNAIAPDPTIKPLLMATIDFMYRMGKGEKPSFPPDLHEQSTIDDYSEWLNRPDMILPPYFTDVYAKIIGHTAEVTTAIVWLKKMAPQEVHDNEYEKFLIVEGTCDIIIEDRVYHLVPGDFLAIPLYKNHHLSVTSNIPCKAILQRVAA